MMVAYVGIYFKTRIVEQTGLHVIEKWGGSARIERKCLLWPLSYDAVVGVYIFNHHQIIPMRPDLSFLSDFSQLTDLKLNDLGICDDDLHFLRHLPRIEVLNLSRNPFGDQGVALLSGNRYLRILYLNHTSFTGETFEADGFLGLEIFYLERTCITDEGLSRVCRLPLLHTLVLSSDYVTDQGLIALKNVQSLRHLTLIGHFSKNGIAILKSMPWLSHYDVIGDDNMHYESEVATRPVP
ncbi:MAG TPA: hypothetical protein VFE24_08945 [Pirellulales bacterium]|nr:hypothetical protein [Pirellulales bacterium]